MAEEKELTFQEISSHNTKKDLYLVIHDKVYDCASFVDEHPYVSLVPYPCQRGNRREEEEEEEEEKLMDKLTEVVKKSSSTSVVRTHQKPLRTLVTVMKPASCLMACLLGS